MRAGPCCRRPDERSPGSRTRSVRACQVLRPRRVTRALALAHADVLPSATQTASAPGNSFLSRLNGWPACTPADASPTPSRMPAHGLGPMWFAIPSSQGTCTPYSLPVSRRTCVKTYLWSWLSDGSCELTESQMKRFVEGKIGRKACCFRSSSRTGSTEDNPVRAVDAFVEALDLVGLGFDRARAGGDRPARIPSGDAAQDLHLRVPEPHSIEPAPGARGAAQRGADLAHGPIDAGLQDDCRLPQGQRRGDPARCADSSSS